MIGNGLYLWVFPLFEGVSRLEKMLTLARGELCIVCLWESTVMRKYGLRNRICKKTSAEADATYDHIRACVIS